MNFFTIKDLENLSGIKAHTIRVWEQRYNFLRPKRTGSNIRYYDGRELKTLLNVALLTKAGFRISQIDQMTEEERVQRVMSLTAPYICRERAVAELLDAVTAMDTRRFEKLLDHVIAEKGFPGAVMRVVFPFLEKIGQLWATSRVLTAQEHFVTAMIRQKFSVAVEGARSRIRRELTFLVFLPEGEWHELGLLYVWYLLKSRGFDVVYLGANLPVADAATVAAAMKIDYVYLHLSAVSGGFRWENLLSELGASFPRTPVVVSGPVTVHATSVGVPDKHYP
jgi:DNA-binding transcriptional MerR regulator